MTDALVKVVLIRSLKIIESDGGYISKENALISGKQSTPDKVVSSLQHHLPTSILDSEKYKDISNEILNWVRKIPPGSNSYITKIQHIINQTDEIGLFDEIRLVASLPYAYSKFLDNDLGEAAKITNVNIRHSTIEESLTFLSKKHSKDYNTYIFKNSQNQLLITFVNHDASAALKFKKGQIVRVSGVVKKVLTGSYLNKYDAIVLIRTKFYS